MTTEIKDRLRVRRRIASFGYALEGWWHVLRTQPNAWIHAVISLIVFAIAFWLDLSSTEWAILILTTTVVWMAEFINTALEAVVDLTMPEVHPLAKAAKDVAAAAVLVGAIGAVVIGLLIMGPPLWQRLFG
ncbi:MAG: diacylglycerol kinase family protein [Anaerolineales bacterium]|uniref:diacylglycerol kinase family protein n=1 Tax=Promineifilum sp. TaxID=2664178 RepID=UPI001DA0022B|nr:diacylglycerol kinase family protein [Anaerolineales bacterium]MCB8934959.1 diacylglycerol kinase family protein [Promineifilum sp.]MCO5178439.1 diacylglycerol kinase family protein [Promineifilum sp.]